MVTVQVNTSLLTTKFKLVLLEDDPVSKILEEVGKKTGESFLNPKLYVLHPVQKHSYFWRSSGEKSLGDSQMTGKFAYESTAIDLNTAVKNLKSNTVELTEKIYVDKPYRKQKEVPIENQHALASTFV